MNKENTNLSFINNFPQEKCVFKNKEYGVLLYQSDSLELMDILKNTLMVFLT